MSRSHLRYLSLTFAAAICLQSFALAAQETEKANTVTPGSGFCPSIAVGADVSFLPQAETEGAQFRDAGEVRPGLEILKSHGYGWVRLRLFNNPAKLPNSLSYTLAAAKQAKALGFGLVLDFHYSDDWADPQHNNVPAAWSKLGHKELTDAVFAYTRDTIAKFREQGILPDIVQIGNEITSGMMWPDGKLPDNWDHFTDLLLAAARGVQEGSRPSRRPAIMIHIDQGGNSETTQWFFSHVMAAHVPFDVIGQSYYPWWQGSLKSLRDNLAFMANTYHKPIVVIETAYSWRPENYKNGHAPYPETPEGQRDFLRAVAETVAATPGGLGKGVFWWEPAVKGALASRGLFDDNGNALPAMHVFDACMKDVEAHPAATGPATSNPPDKVKH